MIAWASDGDVTYNPGMRTGTVTFAVSFYYSKSDGDVPRQYDALLDWVGILLSQLHAQQKLGVTGVRKAYTTRWEIGTLVYAVTTYEAITMTVLVDWEESVTITP